MAAGDVKNPKLAKDGMKRIEWAEREMPVLREIQARFAKEKPLRNQRIAACLHVTTETANLMRTLQAGGAEISLCASNPLSTQDDVAAALAYEVGIPTYAIKGEDNKTYYKHLLATLDLKPTMTLDDGADLVAVLHKDRKAQMKFVIGGMEETTTGVHRLNRMAADKVLEYPIIAVNDADTKHMFDNRYGTGQSTLDGITRATNVLWAGKKVVVCGYGWCGRGVAMRAKGMGSQVIVTEVDPVKALEAAMDGFSVMPIDKAAPQGDIFITVTGGLNTIDKKHFETLKSGAILANSGHFNVEINIKELEKMSESRREIRPFVEEYALENGRKVFLLGEGRLINLVAAEGHPASVMDMSFANQALCAEYLAKRPKALKPGVYPVPPDIDKEVATIKLRSLGMFIDKLSDAQQKYLDSWSEGT